ncbi:MAG: acyloxyacyl hydrolase [Rhodomicrobium sp.]
MRRNQALALKTSGTLLAIASTCIILCPTVRADDFVSEVRLGWLDHDAGIFSNRKEDGADINAEVLFVAPEFLDVAWSPRPDLGFKLNTSGDTDQIYAGLTWTYSFMDSLFCDFSFGPSVHNGNLNKSDPNLKALGSPVLFREALSVGWRFDPVNSMSVILDHISNAGLARYNGGMEDIGIRYGYHF